MRGICLRTHQALSAKIKMKMIRLISVLFASRNRMPGLKKMILIFILIFVKLTKKCLKYLEKCAWKSRYKSAIVLKIMNPTHGY